jgi:hypothetical protein
MEKQNRSSGSAPTGELEFYLSSWMPPQNVAAIMRAEKKDEKEISAFMQQYEESRRRIKKLVQKFIRKVENKYGNLDVPELMKLGLKQAKKVGLTPAEIEAFKVQIIKGDTDKQFLPFAEMEYTEMAKFFGFSAASPANVLNVQAVDQEPLNEIARLYEMTRELHQSVKRNISVYRDCAPEAISGKFNPEKHNVNIFIHPLIAALFLPIIPAVQHRMLFTNIGRMVVHRAAAFLRQYAGRAANETQDELKRDFELAFDIARDPNSLNYFTDESPMSNLLKRFKIQIELFKNVLLLREGKYYSTSTSYGESDMVSGLINVLNSYDWTFFDSPDLFHVQDEGTILRKLLAAFSLRPTFTQLSSFVNRAGFGQNANYGLSRLTFINSPIINVRLPVNVYGPTQGSHVRLKQSLSQNTFIVEKKMIVPKNQTVIYSRDVVFFYINRRYQSVNFVNADPCFKYMSLPGTLTNISNINETEVHFEDTERIGESRFVLRSVTVLNKLSQHPFATMGSSAIIVGPQEYSGSGTNAYLYYNPVGASIKFATDTEFTNNDPITLMPVSSMNPSYPGFQETARRFGTIFIYVEEPKTAECLVYA